MADAFMLEFGVINHIHILCPHFSTMTSTVLNALLNTLQHCYAYVNIHTGGK